MLIHWDQRKRSSKSFLRGRKVDIYVSATAGASPALQEQPKILSDRLDAIGMDEVSLTFRDAIRLARHLQVQYIWIDSFCTIQDADDDWQEGMGEYYGRALFTIGASGVGSKGIFRDRIQTYVSYIFLKTQKQITSQKQSFIPP